MYLGGLKQVRNTFITHTTEGTSFLMYLETSTNQHHAHKAQETPMLKCLPRILDNLNMPDNLEIQKIPLVKITVIKPSDNLFLLSQAFLFPLKSSDNNHINDEITALKVHNEIFSRSHLACMVVPCFARSNIWHAYGFVIHKIYGVYAAFIKEGAGLCASHPPSVKN